MLVTVNAQSQATFWTVSPDGRDRTIHFRSTLEESTTVDDVASSASFVAITMRSEDTRGWRVRVYDPKTGYVVARLSGTGQCAMRWSTSVQLLVWCDRDVNAISLERDRPKSFKLMIVNDYADFTQPTNFSIEESLIDRVSESFRPPWRPESTGTFDASDVTVVAQEFFLLGHGMRDSMSNVYSVLRKSDLSEVFRFVEGYPAQVYHSSQWVLFRTFDPEKAFIYGYDGKLLSTLDAQGSG
jgi:hypothetical protein